MRSAVFHGVRDVRVETVPDPALQAPRDALVRVLAAGICGSDLWYYRGEDPLDAGARLGHEFVGRVEEVGDEAGDLHPGDLVVAPFTYSDGTCANCRRGLTTSCESGGIWGGTPEVGGAQADAVRVPFADATLLRVPRDGDLDPPDLLRLLALSDVLPTGHHAASGAGVGPGSAAVVVGDGPVGLAAVLCARRLGAERVLVLGHHGARLELARKLGATDVAVSDEPAELVRDVLGEPAPAVMECVGTQAAVDAALACVRDGGTVSYVGLPITGAAVTLLDTFDRNVTVRGGISPARTYIPELLADVLAGDLDAAPLFDRSVGLDEVAAGYDAMDRREATKAVVYP